MDMRRPRSTSVDVLTFQRSCPVQRVCRPPSSRARRHLHPLPARKRADLACVDGRSCLAVVDASKRRRASSHLARAAFGPLSVQVSTWDPASTLGAAKVTMSTPSRICPVLEPKRHQGSVFTRRRQTSRFAAWTVRAGHPGQGEGRGGRNSRTRTFGPGGAPMGRVDCRFSTRTASIRRPRTN